MLPIDALGLKPSGVVWGLSTLALLVTIIVVVIRMPDSPEETLEEVPFNPMVIAYVVLGVIGTIAAIPLSLDFFMLARILLS